MIIITGIGRCGTSMMASYLQKIGYNIGSEKWFKRINAGLENKQTLSINGNLLRHFVKKESINLHHVKGEIEDLDIEVAKDPQFLTDARLIKVWHEVRAIKVIWMTRDYNDIVESMKRVPEWNTPVYRLFPEMMAEKEKAFKKALKECKIEYHIFEYGVDGFHDLPEFIELPENAEEIWQKMYSI